MDEDAMPLVMDFWEQCYKYGKLMRDREMSSFGAVAA